MGSIQKRRLKCQRKTKRGNVFQNETNAWSSAKSMTKKVKRPICAYKCQHCKKWHLGKWNRGFSKEALTVLFPEKVLK